MLLEPSRSLLFLVDLQERLAPAIEDGAAVVRRSAILLEAAARLGVPAIVSEQYPQGLGHTVPDLARLVEGATVLPKTCFSAAGDPAIARHLAELRRDQIVLGGMETHVCVLQTALKLKETGYEVAVAADATGSRHPERRRLGLERMRAHGVDITDSEMVLFEWMGNSGVPAFRELSRLIR